MAKAEQTAFGRIYALGEEVVDELKFRLERGESPRTMVAWIQDVLGKARDVRADSFEKQMVRFRRVVVVPELLARVEGKLLRSTGTEAQATLKKIDVIGEMNDSTLVQKQRLEKILTTEAANPALLTQQAHEALTLYWRMLRELGQMYMDTGLLARAPKVVQGVIGAPGGDASFEVAQTVSQRYERTKAAFAELMREEEEDDESAQASAD